MDKRLVTLCSYIFCLHIYVELKLQSINAKMDEAEGGFTPLSQLNPSPEPRYRVRVRISRMWESFNPNNGTVFGLDTLLIDDEVMHTLPNDACTTKKIHFCRGINTSDVLGVRTQS